MINNSDINIKSIYEFIFNYVKLKFNDFGHISPIKLKDGNWWKNHKYGRNQNYGGSWGPFIQWAFINEGFKRGYAVREDHTHSHIFEVANDFDKNFSLDNLPYGAIKPNGQKNKFPKYKKIDVCWGSTNNSYISPEDLILVLEYEDMDKDKAFNYDMESLSLINSKLRVIIVRLFFPDNSRGMSIEKLKQILDEKYQNKNFGFIFIYPLDTCRIIFECYEWNQNKLQIIGKNSFEVKDNEEFVIRNQINNFVHAPELENRKLNNPIEIPKP